MLVDGGFLTKEQIINVIVGSDDFYKELATLSDPQYSDLPSFLREEPILCLRFLLDREYVSAKDINDVFVRGGDRTIYDASCQAMDKAAEVDKIFRLQQLTLISETDYNELREILSEIWPKGFIFRDVLVGWNWNGPYIIISGFVDIEPYVWTYDISDRADTGFQLQLWTYDPGSMSGSLQFAPEVTWHKCMVCLITILKC
jgi:hypothetical protein